MQILFSICVRCISVIGEKAQLKHFFKCDQYNLYSNRQFSLGEGEKISLFRHDLDSKH